MSTEIKYKQEIEIPSNVKIRIENNKIFASGPLGETSKEIKSVFLNKQVFMKIENNKFIAYSLDDKRNFKALVGTIVAHVRNLIDGVTKGYKYTMKIIYSHFPIKVEIDNKNKLVIIRNFLGERTPRIAKIVGNVKVECKEPFIYVSGINIEEVGQTCNNIEQCLRKRITKFDRRIFQDGIFLIERNYMT